MPIDSTDESSGEEYHSSEYDSDDLKDWWSEDPDDVSWHCSQDDLQ